MYIVLKDGRSTREQHIIKDEDGRLKNFLSFLDDNYCLEGSVDWDIVNSLEDLIEDLNDYERR